MYDYRLLKAIQPREFTDKVWTRKDVCKEKAPNILNMVDQYNTRSFWVATQILIHEDPVMVTKTIRAFIDLADACRVQRNYFAVFAIVSGLSVNPVFRLKTHWNALSFSTKKKYEMIKACVTDTNRNCRVYRKLFKTQAGHPQIPHLAVTLKDCFQLEEIATKEKDLINFGKYRKQWSAIKDIFTAQRCPYPALPEAEDLSTPFGVAVAAAFNSALCISEDELWERSYVFEPKKKS